jgi:repressor LexA
LTIGPFLPNICLVSPRDTSKLTARQRQILDFIRDYGRGNGYAPSVRDIGERFKVNPATVHDHLKALERKGAIGKQPHLSRSLIVVGEDDRSNPAGIPLIGQVAAGAPILAEQNIEDTVKLPEGWAPDGSFLLRVHGESMRDAHILDGDLVLVKPQKSATNGEIVVAQIDDEATVKRFYRSEDGIELRPENPAFEPIQVDTSETTSFAIVGKVVGVFRL